MTRTATWKAFALAAALTGAGMFGAAAATAEPKTIGSGSSTYRSSDSVRGGSGKTGLSDSTSQSTRKTKIPLPVRGSSETAGKAGSDTSTPKSGEGSRAIITLPRR